MLIGFSRLAGLALLLIKSPKAFTKLKDGNDAPSCETARATFAELCVTSGARSIPVHLAMLQEQVAEVRHNQSLWTWHLPLPSYEETAQAIVYRANSNSSGTSWSKGLVLPER
jgi:hypothetical protein